MGPSPSGRATGTNGPEVGTVGTRNPASVPTRGQRVCARPAPDPGPGFEGARRSVLLRAFNPRTMPRAQQSGDWSMMDADGNIRINRAPVLTLWATVVAERLGF